MRQRATTVIRTIRRETMQKEPRILVPVRSLARGMRVTVVEVAAV
jgi:hypothetical protein